MRRSSWLLAFVFVLLFAPAAKPQDTIALGLKGRVHTVESESSTSENGNLTPKESSTFSIFDADGYLIESFLYKPDGTLWCHTIMTRDGDRVFQTRVYGTDGFRNYSDENHYDAKGRGIETDEFDGDGFLKKKTVWDFADDDAAHKTVIHWTATGPGGIIASGETREEDDPVTNSSRQIAWVDGQEKTDWVIQEGEASKPESDKITMPDGSYTSHTTMADGTAVEDRFQASTNSHTYQKTDAEGRVTEDTNGAGANFVRSTYSFDGKGRPAGQINYNDAGKIIDKCENEYFEDSVGNWVEERSVCQHRETDDTTRETVVTTRQNISYY